MMEGVELSSALHSFADMRTTVVFILGNAVSFTRLAG
jgi:hypothetical protein